MASLTRGGVETLVQSHGVESRPHRPVLQVVKVFTSTDTVFGQTRTRHKLWLSDGSRWACAYAAQREDSMTGGCLVRVTNYSSTFELTIHGMEVVGPAQPLIGAPTSIPTPLMRPAGAPLAVGSPLPKDAIQPPPLPPPPVAEIEARLAAASVSAAPTMSNATSAIELDVGGAPFKTTLATLSRHPHTFFAALARNRGDATGPIFIDRDPTHFRFILNYLRSGVLAAPADDVAKRELLVEAEFYGMQSFARALCAPELDLTQHLDAAILAERADEQRVRDIYASGDTEALGRLKKYEGLVDFFSAHPRGLCFAAPPPVDSKSTLLYDALEPRAPMGREGSPATVASMSQVVTNFNALYANVLARLERVMRYHSNLFIAGGSCLLALTAEIGTRRTWPLSTRHTTKWGDEGDVDIFVCADTPQQCSEYARQIWNALAIDGEHWKLERGRGVLNMAFYTHQWTMGCSPSLVVQVVLRQYASPTEVLTCFDVDCCCVGMCHAFGAWRVWALPRCLRALQTGRNVVNAIHAWPRSPAYEMRLTKYACRGFAVLCPGLDPGCTDHARVRGESFDALAGVARLLRIANMIEAYAPKTFDDAKTLMIRRFGIKVSYALSGLYDEPVSTLPGEEPLNKGSEFSQIDSQIREHPPDVIATLRRNNSRDIGWRVLSPGQNYTDEDRYALRQASAEQRDALWAAVADAGTDALDVPRRIVWDSTRKQREYLNVRDDADHDAIYYAHAYKY